jgi:hypothetical protein
MTTGAVIFAHNNPGVDYTKMANFAASRVKEFLDIPVTIITDNPQWLLSEYPDHVFDNVITLPVTDPTTLKAFADGSLHDKKLPWKNTTRNQVYNLTPYSKTLVIDSDYIINSSILKIALERDDLFQIYQNSFDLSGWRDTKCFQRINSYAIPFYWATAFVFQKDPVVESFFDLVSYIKANWLYFRTLYNIDVAMFRNDFAFSIAIHIMNGKTNGEFTTPLPGTMTYILDRDIILDIDGPDLKFLVEKQGYLGEYIAAKTSGIDVHVMNKLSLSRVIDGGLGV